MRVLVTGGAGYIGTRLCAELLYAGVDVSVLDLMIYGKPPLRANRHLKLHSGDVRDISLLKQAARDCDVVVHLANLSNDSVNDTCFAESYSVNVASFEPLLRVCAMSRISRFIFASSTSVYGKRNHLIVDEAATTSPISRYASWKLECEQILGKFASSFEIVVVRAATVCGPSQRQRLDLLINRLTTQAFFEHHVRYNNSGSIRPAVHIDDVARAYVALAVAQSSSVVGQTFNVAYENRTVQATAAMVLAECGESRFVDEGGNDDCRSYAVSANKIASRIGFLPHKTTAIAVQELLARLRCGLFGDYKASHYYNAKAERAYFAKEPSTLGVTADL